MFTLMNSEVAWVLVFSETQVHPQIILDADYLPNYLSVSYDSDTTNLTTYKVLFFFQSL